MFEAVAKTKKRLDSEILWIEFQDEKQYMKWLRSIMFLLKTTAETCQGVRDPRRQQAHQMTINEINADLGNITEIEEPERTEVWKDIKISFQPPKK